MPSTKLLSDLQAGRVLPLKQKMTPMELAEQYATLGRGGVHRKSKITVEAGSRVESSRILGRSSCCEVLECLGDVGRTRRVCPKAADLSPAWKASASNEDHDAWCAAVTPRFTVVVWLENVNASMEQGAAAALALQILATIEPTDKTPLPGFAPPPDFLTSVQQVAGIADNCDLSMLCPVNHQRITIDDGLSAAPQRVPLRVQSGDASKDELFWWLVDGQCIGMCHNDQPLWWNPTAGPHEIRVINATGQAVTTNVEVAAR